MKVFEYSQLIAVGLKSIQTELPNVVFTQFIPHCPAGHFSDTIDVYELRFIAVFTPQLQSGTIRTSFTTQ
jgi:hypothetical protein